jgi:hypothetical protein
MSNFSQRQDHYGKTKKKFIKAKVDALKVTNETAERANGFFNKDPRTTNEETFQEILQWAENHCQM